MITLQANILINKLDYGTFFLKAEQEETLEMLERRVGDCVRSGMCKEWEKQVKVEIWYESYQIDNESRIKELFYQGDSIVVKIEIQTVSEVRTQTSLSRSEEVVVGKRKVRGKNKRKRRKKIGKNKRERRGIMKMREISVNGQILLKHGKLYLSATKLTFHKMIQFTDNYLLFSLEHRHKRFQQLHNIKRYFNDKYGCSFEIQALNEITRICPNLYDIKRIKNHGTYIKLKDFTTTQQRIQLFDMCLLQFQNTPFHVPQKRVCGVAPIAMAPKRILDPRSIFSDKGFSEKLKRIVVEREQMIEESKRVSKEEVIKQYLVIVEQIQLFKTMRRANPTRDIFYEEISKRVQSSNQTIHQCLQFISDRSKYIECVSMDTLIKIIINTQLFSEVKTVITTM